MVGKKTEKDSAQRKLQIRWAMCTYSKACTCDGVGATFGDEVQITQECVAKQFFYCQDCDKKGAAKYMKKKICGVAACAKKREQLAATAATATAGDAPEHSGAEPHVVPAAPPPRSLEEEERKPHFAPNSMAAGASA